MVLFNSPIISRKKEFNIEEKISISLTQFLDYSLKPSGTQKVTSVRKIKNSIYHPSHDFWKELREAIPYYHQHNLDHDYLDQIAHNVYDNRKERYIEAVKTYKRFLKKKEVKWLDPGKAFWTHERLAVKSSTEVGLIINDQPTLLKLYFKQEQLDKKRTKTALALMESSARSLSNSHEDAVISILDVNRNKVYNSSKEVNTDVMLALQGEAAQFIQIWDRV